MADERRWLDPVWMQHGLDALRETLDVGPNLKPQMIDFLLKEGFWDGEKLSWESATARFNGCLNPNKADFFKFSEIWALMKRFDRHALFHAMAADLGYEEPRRKTTEARRLELLERLVVAVERLGVERDSVVSELDRLGIGQAVRLDPAIREGVGRFSLPIGGF